MLKIILSGCSGKMGSVITELVSEDTEAEIVAGVALIVRVVVFIRTICKRSSMIKAYKTKRENLN